MGNSDDLRVGEWVLAVGNPFNLTSTVTAGIVSAKARNINILNAEMKIESFIQTDAAVNPGNSGGALVNTRGELVGINTAIASQTGSYSGYSFAVPTSIVRKVVNDIRQYGVVQRAILGVQMREITSELKKEKKLTTLQGAYVERVVPDGAAEKAGIKSGDVITRVDDAAVKTGTDLQEHIGRHRPGDVVSVTLLRDGKTMTVRATLTNRDGGTGVISAEDNASVLGATFSDLPALLGAFALGPVYGVVISFMKNLLHIIIKGTSTACVGELCNFMLGAVFSAVAGFIYKRNKSRKTAILGAIAGAAAMAVFSVPSNYFITYPAYVQFYHMPLEAILGMYQAILPSADSLIKCLVIFNMPFTLVKGLLDAVLCMVIYKPLSPILHGRK